MVISLVFLLIFSHSFTIDASNPPTKTQLKDHVSESDEVSSLSNSQVSVNFDPSEIYLRVGYIKNLSLLMTPHIEGLLWSSSNPSVATVDGKGMVRAMKEGGTRISVTYYDSANRVTYAAGSCYVNVIDSIGIANLTQYYIMNLSDDGYLSLSTLSDTNGTNVVCSKAGPLTSKWIVNAKVDGTYAFQCNYSKTKKVLDITNGNADIFDDHGYPCERFILQRINLPGGYSGMYLIRQGNKFLTKAADNNVILTDTTTFYSYWTFISVEKRNTEIYSFRYPEYESTANNFEFARIFRNIGRYGYNNYRVNSTPSEAYNNLKNDDIFVYRGHGAPGEVGFYDSNGNTQGRLTVSPVVDSDSKNRYVEDYYSNELKFTRCILLLGCNTGVPFRYNGESYNLMRSLFQKGAHFVLGTSDKTDSKDSDNFLSGFLETVAQKQNISKCIVDGCRKAGFEIYRPGSDSFGGYPVTYIGDVYQNLCIN